jgi:HEPN domain-containing protein
LIEIPEEVKEGKMLTAYAVETRYPGDYIPVSEDDYLKAVRVAEKVIEWVEKRISE